MNVIRLVQMILKLMLTHVMKLACQRTVMDQRNLLQRKRNW
jgi:hypothetical protein